MSRREYLLNLNPEPWAIGPLSVGRKGGKVFPSVGRNEQLYAFKQAVAEALSAQDPEEIIGPVKLTIWLSRQQIAYKTPQAKTHRKHEADATNMQKAIEDACQGILYKNDKDVKDVRTVVVDQGPEAIGLIVIQIEPWTGLNMNELGAWGQALFDRQILVNKKEEVLDAGNYF